MFFTKGEGLRNILLFGSFFLWLITIKERNLSFLKDRISILFLSFIGSMILSAFFSFNTSYSILALREEALKMLLIYPMIVTVLNKTNRLKILLILATFTSLTIALIGFYSYFFYKLPMVKPNTEILHAWHNKFAFYLNIYHPFILGYLFLSKTNGLKGIIILVLMITITALFMSTSRGGYLGLITIILIWLFYLKKNGSLEFKKIFLIIFVLTCIFVLTFNFSPYVKDRIKDIQSDIFTMNNRTIAWKTAFAAALNRPIFGWGIGGDLFKEKEIYRSINSASPPIGPHNLFIRITFHQGFLGLGLFLILVFYTIKNFFKTIDYKNSIENYILISTVAAIIGNYLIHCMLEDRSLVTFAIFVGIGMAAKYLSETKTYENSLN
jgi:O-antigen ligase